MFQEQAATLRPGDWLDYELSREPQENGTCIVTLVPAEFVKPGSNRGRIVIRPWFKNAAWNRARSVTVARVTVIAQFPEREQPQEKAG